MSVVPVEKTKKKIMHIFSYINFRFEATGRLFWDKPPNFDQMTRTTPQMAPPLQTFAPHRREGVYPLTYDLMCNRPTYTADLQWNRVRNLEHSCTQAETLSIDHRCSCFYNRRQNNHGSIGVLSKNIHDRTTSLSYRTNTNEKQVPKL
ncbi:hypothetical protein AVEN_216249-1 [Araneus ventricosus]|uniref:Uncharacterized protein n=1 Tax=Araneus ventricosus TaxID=182803 RepID=A0A4Y2HQZ1_ARAVE|nr:hypothetical protein AVEN_216249-1 [Araneus ventricosus]